MKMRSLLLGAIFGLLAVVHSTPVDTVTQIPIRTEDDVFHEAVTDGFLIDPHFLPSLTTESPKRNTTLQASELPSTESGESDMIEGSASGESKVPTFFQHHHATTTQSVSHAQVSTTTESLWHNDEPSSDLSSVTPDHISVSQTTVTAVDIFGSGSGDGEMAGHPTSSSFNPLSSDSSGDWEVFDHYPAISSSVTSSPNTETDTASSTTMPARNEKVPRLLMDNFVLQTIADGHKSEETFKEAAPQNQTHGTPGWIIIVGFIVGVAALVMICVAIATREKWNGPNQASQLETKTNSSHQQREQEMETFLPRENGKPKENGKAAEYTVIPLDELPEKYPSH